MTETKRCSMCKQEMDKMVWTCPYCHSSTKEAVLGKVAGGVIMLSMFYWGIMEAIGFWGIPVTFLAGVIVVVATTNILCKIGR